MNVKEQKSKNNPSKYADLVLGNFSDIMVVLKTYRSITRVLERVEERYRDHRHPTTVTPIQFITETIGNLNKAIDKGHYFYTDIKKEGIMLYDSSHFQLAESRKLNFAEIKAWAEEYFNERFTSANEFLDSVEYFCGKGQLKKAVFMLHQAIENYYLGTILTYTLYSEKEHSLTKLAAAAKTHYLETAKAFPRNTPEEIRLFDLLEKAYVQARYNPLFHVTKEDIEAIIPKVELLRDITKRACREKIEYYQKETERQ